MYFPYFRGKQFDLITIKECAEVMTSAGFIPIVEPVKEPLGGLKRSIDAVNSANGRLILIVNPSKGEHAEDPVALAGLMQHDLRDCPNISAGILLTQQTPVDEALKLCEQYRHRQISLIHCGFGTPSELKRYLSDGQVSRHIFVESSNLYRRHFNTGERVLVKDGFERRANRKHPVYEEFSDLHVTFRDENLDGFGDFLIVGDEYSDGGGPAYAVAIHLTCIDPAKDDAMFIHHFKSDRFDTPVDVAGKFAEALQKLADEVSSAGTNILPTPAVQEFLQLHHDGHFPGLGYVKKLSMNHHIHTLAAYLSGTGKRAVALNAA